MADYDEFEGALPTSSCEGLSYTQMLDLDTREVPDFLRAESQQEFGNAPLSVDRYISPEFMRLENEKMWPKVWQFAAREEELPNPGDKVVFENAGKSYLIIRQEDGSVRAFHNVCLHRGRKLRTESGYSEDLQCPFHGFTWANDGSLKDVPCAWDFEHLDGQDMSLPELRVDLWQGFIMVSENQDMVPFAQWIGPVNAHYEKWRLDECYTAFWVARVVPANWKVTAEAFMEAWHSIVTHPQILPYTGDSNTRYDLFGDNANRAITPSGVLSPHIAADFDQNYVLERLMEIGGRRAGGGGVDPKALAEGYDQDDPVMARKALADLHRKVFGEASGKDYSAVSDTEMLDNFTYNFFPNFSAWGGFVPNLVYRWRTGKDQDHCMMEIRILKRKPKDGPVPECPPMHLISEDETFADAGHIMGVELARVFDQDLMNLPYVQEGLKASQNGEVQLGRYQESRIRHFHNTLDKYLNS